MNDIHKDIVQINKIVKVYKKLLIWSSFMILANAIVIYTNSDFLRGFSSSFNPFIAIFGVSICMRVFSGNNYILISTLPVKMNNITEMIFRLYELTCLINYAGLCIIAVVRGNYTGILSCAILLLITLIFGYIGIYAMSSEQLAVWLKPASSSAKGFALYMLFFVVFIVLNTLIRFSFEEFKKSLVLIILSIIGILALAVITFYVRRLTYNKTYIKIRGIKMDKKAKT